MEREILVLGATGKRGVWKKPPVTKSLPTTKKKTTV